MERDTIAAIATPRGTGGVAMIRVSGADAFAICDRLFQGKKKLSQMEGYTLAFGELVQRGTIVDQVLCSVFRAPHSFTGEHVVEIQCHGGERLTDMVLQAVVDAGARPALPGEFSKRAFLNGKMDLTQAEAIVDMIQAKGSRSVENAVQHLEGKFSAKIQTVRQVLLGMQARILAVIDFPDEDLESEDREAMLVELQQQIQTLEQILQGFAVGKVLQSGLVVSLIGKTNVGKSSLLNALVQEEKAIVTDIAGTTRDRIEEQIEIKGIPVRLMDTAGIRKTEDAVESIGVERAKEQIAKSDLVLHVVDQSRPWDSEDEEIRALMQDVQVITIYNKGDLPASASLPKPDPCITVSCVEQTGLDLVYEAIYQVAAKGLGEDVVLTNLRHRQCLERAKEALQSAKENLQSGIEADLISIDLEDACRALGELDGVAVSEEVVQQIFSQFCVGK